MDLTDLKRSITMCKEGINVADKNLEKLTGRNVFKSENFTLRSINKRRITNENENIEIKKPRTDREAPTLNSVVRMTKGRTRDDAISELKRCDNPKEKERCKRLFGHMMGTLNTIKKEAEKASQDPQTITRMKIEKKVEENNKIISESIRKEQDELLKAKKERQNDLKALNQRYRAAEAFDRWRAEKEKMKGYIRTCQTPHIFYLPKVVSDEAKLRIDQTIREIDGMIENRKKRLEIDINKAVKISETHLTNEAVKPISEENKMDFDDSNTNQIKDKWVHSDEEDIVSKGEEIMKRNCKFTNERKHSVGGDSCASEDYDDMIDEIEITMHDEIVPGSKQEDGNDQISQDGLRNKDEQEEKDKESDKTESHELHRIIINKDNDIKTEVEQSDSRDVVMTEFVDIDGDTVNNQDDLDQQSDVREIVSEMNSED